jgi:hypothetical protein
MGLQEFNRCLCKAYDLLYYELCWNGVVPALGAWLHGVLFPMILLHGVQLATKAVIR